MDINHLSYSSIELYLNCPEAWRRKYIAKETTKATSSLVFGSAFHGTVEELISRRQFDKIPEIWMEQWNKALGRQEVEWGMDLPEAICNDGLRMLSNKAVQDAIAGIQAKQDERGHMIERELYLRIPGVIPIKGLIDVILEDGTPADIKTSSRSWGDDKASGSMQSLFYIAMLNQAGMPVNWKFKHLVFVKTKEPKVQVLEHEHKPAELFFLFELIKRVWDGIQKESFQLNPTGWKCCEAYCDFWSNCRGRYLK